MCRKFMICTFYSVRCLFVLFLPESGPSHHDNDEDDIDADDDDENDGDDDDDDDVYDNDEDDINADDDDENDGKMPRWSRHQPWSSSCQRRRSRDVLTGQSYTS